MVITQVDHMEMVESNDVDVEIGSINPDSEEKASETEQPYSATTSNQPEADGRSQRERQEAERELSECPSECPSEFTKPCMEAYKIAAILGLCAWFMLLLLNYGFTGSFFKVGPGFWTVTLFIVIFVILAPVTVPLFVCVVMLAPLYVRPYRLTYGH